MYRSEHNGHSINGRQRALVWTPERPVAELPNLIADYFREEAAFLHHDLASKRNQTGLIPRDHLADPYEYTDMKRAADVMNPEWYRDFYHGNGVQRYRTLLSLARITEGRDYPFSQEGKWTFEWRTYDAFYRGYIKERLVDGIPEMPERGETRMYEPVVRAYFGKPLAEDEMPEGGLDELLTDAMIDRAWEGRPGIPSIDGDPPF